MRRGPRQRPREDVTLALLFVVAAAFGPRGPWASLVAFCAILFLATWAGGIWSAPLGPPLWGVHWLPFVLAGLVVALVLAAARRPAKRGTPAARSPGSRTGRVAAVTFFWIVVVVLMLAIVGRYLAGPAGNRSATAHPEGTSVISTRSA